LGFWYQDIRLEPAGLIIAIRFLVTSISHERSLCWFSPQGMPFDVIIDQRNCNGDNELQQPSCSPKLPLYEPE
jgi:hypothetical protein